MGRHAVRAGCTRYAAVTGLTPVRSTGRNMMPQLIVDVEVTWAIDIEPIVIEIDGTESEDELESMASEAFFEKCNFAWHIEDK